MVTATADHPIRDGFSRHLVGTGVPLENPLNANTSVILRSIHLCVRNAAGTANNKAGFASQDHPRRTVRARMVMPTPKSCVRIPAGSACSRAVAIRSQSGDHGVSALATSRHNRANQCAPWAAAGSCPTHIPGKDGWGARIRTWECRYQKPVPYHLATPQ